MDSLQRLDLHTCVLSIDHTARLNLLDNNLLFTVESLIWKFSCVLAFMRMRACFKLQSRVVKFLMSSNVWVCYNFIGAVSWVFVI